MSRFCRSDDNRQDIETRRHILSQVARAASALNYVPNRLADTLAGSKGPSIGQALSKPLTTLASQREHIGFIAATHMLDRLAGAARRG